MHRSRSSLVVVTVAAAVAALSACADRLDPTSSLASAGSPQFHVGYKGLDVPLGYVTNDAECHVGKKGDRWPVATQYDVSTFDAHLTMTPSGVITLVCVGDIPSNQPRPSQAEVEEGVLCFLPGQRQTRQAQEVFTPGGKIILTCHLNPNQS